MQQPQRQPQPQRQRTYACGSDAVTFVLVGFGFQDLNSTYGNWDTRHYALFPAWIQQVTSVRPGVFDRRRADSNVVRSMCRYPGAPLVSSRVATVMGRPYATNFLRTFPITLPNRKPDAMPTRICSGCSPSFMPAVAR